MGAFDRWGGMGPIDESLPPQRDHLQYNRDQAGNPQAIGPVNAFISAPPGKRSAHSRRPFADPQAKQTSTAINALAITL